MPKTVSLDEAEANHKTNLGTVFQLIGPDEPFQTKLKISGAERTDCGGELSGWGNIQKPRRLG